MHMNRDWHERAPAAKAGGAAVVVAAHAGAVALLLQLEPVRSTLSAAAPLMVRLIAPAPVEPPREPPKPRIVKREVPRAAPKPQPQPQPPSQPVLAAPTEVPQALPVAPTPVPPAPPKEVAPPAPPPVAQAPVIPPAPVAPPPAPLVAPRYDADYLANPPPAYPPLSRRMGEEGKVVLRVLVNERGFAEDVQVRTSSGFPRLDAAALESVRHWKFVPARRGDAPAAAWVLVPLSFSLRS